MELSDIVGVSRDTIGKYERNDIVPTVEKAKKIAETFAVSLDYLVSAEAAEQKEVIDKDMAKRINEINSLKEDDKDKILSIVDAYLRDYKTRQAYTQ